MEAMGGQKERAHPFVKQRADEVVALNHHQVPFHGEGNLLVDSIRPTGWSDVSGEDLRRVEADQGRGEMRHDGLTPGRV